MANVKISDLTAASAAAAANEFEINEAGSSKKVTGSQIAEFVKADLLDDTTVNFTGTLQNGSSNVVVDSAIGSTVQAYDANTAKYDDTTANFTGTLQNGGSNVLVDSDINSTVGTPNIEPVGTQTSSYTLTTSDVGKYVKVSIGGSVTIPDATFTEGDVITIYNANSSAITITCSISVANIAGSTTDEASVSLAERGIATVLITNSAGTTCVITGNVS